MAFEDLLDQLKEQNQKKEIQIGDLTNKELEISGKFKKITVEHNELSRKFNRLEEQYSQERNGYRETEEAREYMENLINKLRNEKEELTKKSKVLKNNFDELRRQNSELKEDINDWKAETTKLRKQIAVIEEYSRYIDEPDRVFSDKLHQVIDELVSELRNESKRLNSEIVSLQLQNNDLENENSELRRQK
jgi:polyhydroxyalkanoate synthesis regulator phasin